MLVVLALLFALFGGPNVSLHDTTSGGPSLLGAPPAAYDGTSGGPSSLGPVDDGTSGGPSRP